MRRDYRFALIIAMITLAIAPAYSRDTNHNRPLDRLIMVDVPRTGTSGGQEAVAFRLDAPALEKAGRLALTGKVDAMVAATAKHRGWGVFSFDHDLGKLLT